MTQAEYENQCEMLSVMDRPIKMKTVILTTDILDGKQRTHVDWASKDFKRSYNLKNNNEIRFL